MDNRIKNTGWELDDYYSCSKCGCSNESCRCPDDYIEDEEED